MAWSDAARAAALEARRRRKLGLVRHFKLPPEPGTRPIPPGHVRLYHQTTEANAKAIEKNGLTIAHAKGVEGPRAIYASETGFYGKPSDRPTIEFHVPRDKWQSPFVLQDVPRSAIIARHLPWHQQARYLMARGNEESLSEVRRGLMKGMRGDTGKAVRFVRLKTGVLK
jgi:hypothetical protein